MQRPCEGSWFGKILCDEQPTKERCGRCGWNPESTVREERIARLFGRGAEEPERQGG